MHSYLEFSLELEDMGLPGSCLVLKLGFLLTGEMKWASSGDIFLGRVPLTQPGRVGSQCKRHEEVPEGTGSGVCLVFSPHHLILI